MEASYVYKPRTDAENATMIANIARLYVKGEGLSKDDALIASAKSFRESASTQKISEWENILRASSAILDGKTELGGIGNVREFARCTMGA